MFGYLLLSQDGEQKVCFDRDDNEEALALALSEDLQRQSAVGGILSFPEVTRESIIIRNFYLLHI